VAVCRDVLSARRPHAGLRTGLGSQHTTLGHPDENRSKKSHDNERRPLAPQQLSLPFPIPDPKAVLLRGDARRVPATRAAGGELPGLQPSTAGEEEEEEEGPADPERSPRIS